MAQLSIPWPETAGPIIGDGREYTDAEWRQIWRVVWQQAKATVGYVLPTSTTGDLTGRLAVTAPAANDIKVATGAALVDGIFYLNDAVIDLVPVSAGAGTTRKDRVVLRGSWGAGAEQYTVRAYIKQGDAVNPPVLITVRNTTWEVSLAQYVIDDAGTITGLTDERDYVHMATQVSTTMIDDLAVTNAKLATGAVGASKIGDSQVTTIKILDLNVTEGKLAASSVTNTKLGANAVTPDKVLDRTRRLFVPATSAYNHTLTQAIGNAFSQGFPLPDAQVASAYGFFAVPTDFASGMTIRGKVICGATGNVRVDTRAYYAALGAIWTSGAVGSEMTTAVVADQNNALTSYAPIAAAGQYMHLECKREGAHAQDTAAGILYFAGWIVDYTADS